MTFTSTEKQSIVSVLLAVMNADGEIAADEVLYFEQIKGTLNLTDTDFEKGKDLNGTKALTTISNMSAEKKIAVGVMMQQMVQADGVIDQTELKMFNLICILTGIDKVASDAVSKLK